MAHSQTTSAAALLGRFFWMLIGPLVLLLLTFSIVSGGSGWWTIVDFAFWATLAAMLLGRWLEFRGGNPQTADGEPATAAHFRRYALLAGLVALGVWVVANLLGNHWLAG
jgi:hypothetical protein